MLGNATTFPRFEPKPWSKSLDLYVLTAIFCAFVAAVRTLEAPSLERFSHWLLVTECVGFAGVTCGLVLSRIPWLRRHRPLVAHLCIGAVAIPFAFVAGNTLAYTLLGEPIAIFQPGPRRVIALMATSFAAIFVVYLDAIRERYDAEAAARSEAQRVAVESQLRLLRAQLEPHMLFNTLANLRSLVDVDARLAQTMIDRLIVYLRGALAASRQESTSLRHEFAQLRAYLEIMALRMGPRLRFRLELPDALEHTTIPPMLLQPLVENAIKHGLEPKIGDGVIEVTASQTNGVTEICISDSGLGWPDGAEDDAGPLAAAAVPGVRAADGGGYGLEHVRERLRTYYGARASLSLVRNEPQGVRAIVRIPT